MTANGKENIDKKELTNKPRIKKAIERAVQIIHNASLTVNNQIMPSRLNSNIKPNGHLKERQKKKNMSAIKFPQKIWVVIVKEPTVKNINAGRVEVSLVVK